MIEYRCKVDGVVAVRDGHGWAAPERCPWCGGPVSVSLGTTVAAKSYTLQVTQNDRGPVVLLGGELDLAAAPDLRHCLGDLIGQHVTLDFSDVTFVDSTLIGVLVIAHARTVDAGGTIALHDVQPPQMRLLALAGLEYLMLTGHNTATNISEHSSH